MNLPAVDGGAVPSRRASIAATQMLDSMIVNTHPTRADTSNGANAVLGGTDALMLSGEQSVGTRPIEFVRTMARIIEEVESDPVAVVPPLRHLSRIQPELISQAARTSARILTSRPSSRQPVRRHASLARHQHHPLMSEPGETFAPASIAVLTSGGDARGMNPAVRAVVRTALHHGIDVYAIYEGYQGLVEGGDLIRRMESADVGGILQRGGTVHRHRPIEGVPHPGRAPARGRAEPGGPRHRRAGRDRRRRQPDRRQPVPARNGRSCSAELVDAGELPPEAADGAPVPAARRAGRLDRQRHVRHRHDDRRRHRAAPDRRGAGCPAQHRLQPPAHLRRRGDGPALRLPGADGIAGHRGELGDRSPSTRRTDDWAQQMCQCRRGRAGTAAAGEASSSSPRAPRTAHGNPITATRSRRCWRRSSARTPGSRSSGTSSAAERPARSTAT